MPFSEHLPLLAFGFHGFYPVWMDSEWIVPSHSWVWAPCQPRVPQQLLGRIASSLSDAGIYKLLPSIFQGFFQNDLTCGGAIQMSCCVACPAAFHQRTLRWSIHSRYELNLPARGTELSMAVQRWVTAHQHRVCGRRKDRYMHHLTSDEYQTKVFCSSRECDSARRRCCPGLIRDSCTRSRVLGSGACPRLDGLAASVAQTELQENGDFIQI
jgi:hypothetical protein